MKCEAELVVNAEELNTATLVIDSLVKCEDFTNYDSDKYLQDKIDTWVTYINSRDVDRWYETLNDTRDYDGTIDILDCRKNNWTFSDRNIVTFTSDRHQSLHDQEINVVRKYDHHNNDGEITLTVVDPNHDVYRIKLLVNKGSRQK